MSFKKLEPSIKQVLAEKEFIAPTKFQKQAISKIKSGVNLFGIGPEGCGKTTALIIGVIQKLKSAFEDAPRALIIVENKEKALELESQFLPFLKPTDLRLYLAYDEQRFDHQKDEIYDGVDIVIATPKRLTELFQRTGINVTQLQMYIIDDAEFLTRGTQLSLVNRIPESIPKCQYIMSSTLFHDKLERLQDSFMFGAHLVTVK